MSAIKTSTQATELVSRLYRNWADSLSQHDLTWLTEHLADDFLFTSFLIPGPAIRKTQFLEIAAQLADVRLDFRGVWAEIAGPIIMSHADLDVEERFLADLGPAMPRPEELTQMVSGRRLIYASAWRPQRGRWQCFSHHQVTYAD